MEDIKLIGVRIKELRKKRKISQEQLAEMTGVNNRTVLRIENGHTCPTLETLAKFAEVLGCGIADFFETRHLKSRRDIIEEINNKLGGFSDEELRLFYINFCLM